MLPYNQTEECTFVETYVARSSISLRCKLGGYVRVKTCAKKYGYTQPMALRSTKLCVFHVLSRYTLLLQIQYPSGLFGIPIRDEGRSS